MGISYQTRNRLRRKVHTAPLTAPAPAHDEAVAIQAAAPRRTLWWPMAAAVAVFATAFSVLYRG